MAKLLRLKSTIDITASPTGSSGPIFRDNGGFIEIWTLQSSGANDIYRLVQKETKATGVTYAAIRHLG